MTGVAGFIGFHVAQSLLKSGNTVVGIDNLSTYYEVQLKKDRLKILHQFDNDCPNNRFIFFEKNLTDLKFVMDCFEKHKVARVIHLAAQAGVRYSLVNPHSYVESNIVAFTNLLEACRHNSISQLIYASTSSVYGANTCMPFNEAQGADHPLQFYAATKRANELMAHSYSHLYNLPTVGLRFFTVYGPWGRPDMALFKFTKNILEGKPIDVFNSGNHSRDFTYVDDIVEGIIRVNNKIVERNDYWDSSNPNPSSSNAPYRIFNIGNNNPIKLNEYIKAIEETVHKKAIKNMMPLQMGDVPDTYADSSALDMYINYKPATKIEYGVHQFVNWYREYYKV